MTLAQLPALKKLPASEKFALADELWLDAMSDKSTVPAHHKKILDERWRDYKAGKIKTITFAELERRLDKK